MAEIRSLSKNHKKKNQNNNYVNENKQPQFHYIHALIREPVAVHDTAPTKYLYDQMSLATNHT
jgi:hypothetical protein